MNSPVKPSKSDPRVLNLRLVRYDEMAQYDDFMDQSHRRGALRRIGRYQASKEAFQERCELFE